MDDHELELAHPDRETWTARCSCGQWVSRFSLDDVPLDRGGDLLSIATADLERRHREHVAAAR